MLLSRNFIFIVKSKNIPFGSNTDETKDRTFLGVISSGTFCSVPLPVSTFQFSPRIEDDCGSASKFSLIAFICLFLGSVNWLLRHVSSISSN